MDLIGVGFCTHDEISIVPRMPQFEEAVPVIAFSEQGGGPAATGTVAASRLGASCAFAGRIGGDRSGDFIRQDFEHYGVNTEYLIADPQATSSKFLVLVEESTGSRAFIGRRASAQPLTEAELPLEAIQQAKLLLLDESFPELSLAAARAAKAAHVTVLLDSSGSTALTKELLAYVDIFIPARFFFPEFTGISDPLKAAVALLDYGPEEVVVTIGEQGCAYATRGEQQLLPAFPVTPVVDTTGCGDVFHGAYAYAKLQGWETRKSAQFASAVAALKCRAIGGRMGIPDLTTTLGFLQDQRPTEW